MFSSVVTDFSPSTIHSRAIETLHFLNGKYTGYCIKYKIETVSFREMLANVKKYFLK